MSESSESCKVASPISAETERVKEDTHRLDVELVARGLARSRGQAHDLVKAGSVLLEGTPATKVSTPVRSGQSIKLVAGVESALASRGINATASIQQAAPVADAAPPQPQQAPSPSFCAKCGSSLATGVKFCSKCGSPI